MQLRSGVSLIYIQNDVRNSKMVMRNNSYASLFHFNVHSVFEYCILAKISFPIFVWINKTSESSNHIHLLLHNGFGTVGECACEQDVRMERKTLKLVSAMRSMLNILHAINEPLDLDRYETKSKILSQVQITSSGITITFRTESSQSKIIRNQNQPFLNFCHWVLIICNIGGIEFPFITLKSAQWARE